MHGTCALESLSNLVILTDLIDFEEGLIGNWVNTAHDGVYFVKKLTFLNFVEIGPKKSDKDHQKRGILPSEEEKCNLC
jgi:hypothetical protein